MTEEMIWWIGIGVFCVGMAFAILRFKSAPVVIAVLAAVLFGGWWMSVNTDVGRKVVVYVGQPPADEVKP